MAAETVIGRDERATRAGGNGDLRLQPARRRKIPWVAVGVLLVLGSGVAFSVWATGVGDRQPVLALRADVAAGEELTADHLDEVLVGTDARVNLVAADALDRMVGRVAVVDLPRGTLVAREHFSEGTPLASGEAVVGVAVEPGAAPLAHLRAGDRVLVVETPPESQLPEEAASFTPTTWAGAVFDISPVEGVDGATLGRVAVSLEVPEADAPHIAAAAAAGRVRLVLVSDGTTAQESAPVVDGAAKTGGEGET